MGCARRYGALAQPSHDQADQDQHRRHGQDAEPKPRGLTGSRTTTGMGGTGRRRARNGSGETPGATSHLGPAVLPCRRRLCATDRHDHSVSQLPRLARFAGWIACAAPKLPHQITARSLRAGRPLTDDLAQQDPAPVGTRGRIEVYGPTLPGPAQHRGGLLSRHSIELCAFHGRPGSTRERATTAAGPGVSHGN